ncbi:MAG TPA: hypothetical protein VFA98_09960 [Thermoanaerobaculia bacterium]|nr:hypothetical protein [Thermoanaerobaculia bacterium]
MSPYREGNAKIERPESPTTLERWLAIYRARRAMAEGKEKKKMRSSTRAWIYATVYGVAAMFFGNVYMFFDTLHGRNANILAKDGAALCALFTILALANTTIGCDRRWSQKD